MGIFKLKKHLEKNYRALIGFNELRQLVSDISYWDYSICL
jgi:hypothetical protein